MVSVIHVQQWLESLIFTYCRGEIAIAKSAEGKKNFPSLESIYQLLTKYNR